MGERRLRAVAAPMPPAAAIQPTLPVLTAAPVVTISLGDTCVFRFAGVDRRSAPFTSSRRGA